jgi:HK97 family phage major capsid protein
MTEETTTSTLDILESPNAVKIIAQDDNIATVGGYGVVFGGKDLEGETFTRATDYMLDLVPNKLVFYEHGQREDVAHKIGIVANEDVIPDDTGLWIQAELDKSAAYVDSVLKLIDEGVLGWSSGSVAHLARRKGGVIKTWPLVEFSLTPTPAEPRTLGVEVIKQMAKTDPSLKALLPEDAQESISADATAGEVEATVSDSLAKESKKMSETQDAPVLTADAIAQAMGAQLDERFEPVMKRLETLEKSQPADDGGTDVTVVTDEADNALKGNPFKTFGEFLQTLARNDRDKRLRAVKSKGDGMGGYFDVTKAMGSKFVGSMKAPTGLQEGIPSEGGFLVGTDRASGLLGRVYNVGQLIQRADMVGISAGSNGMSFYAEDETSRANGSRRGGIRAYWAAEAEEKTASQPKFREMELKLRKAIGLVYATDELLADANALESWIMQNLPEELSFVVEDSMINGSGVGMPLGILNSGATVSVAKETGQAAATIVAENISKMWARRWLGGRNYVWLYNQDVEPELDNLALAVGTGGSLVYMPPGGLSQAPYGSIKGAPAIPVEYCATLGTVGDLMLVDLSQYQMIDKGGVMSDSSIHVRFIYDETVFRFVYRVDGQPKWDAALTPFKGTNTVSPFVTLATRA